MVLFVASTGFGQITQPLTWTKAYDQTTFVGTGISFPIAAGANRILVVGLTTTFDDDKGSGNQADPATISYGGLTLTKATGNGVTSGRMHTWLYFLKENAVMDATSRPLAVTGGAVTGATLANMTVWYAVYAGVDQTPATYTTGNGLNNNGSNGPAQLSAVMAVNTNEQGVYISNIYNDNSATIPVYSVNANWTGEGINSGTNTSAGKTVAWKVQLANRSIPTSNTTDQAATSGISPTGNVIRYAMSAMSLPKASTPPTITSFTPASGCASTTPVVITGTNFTDATAVTFGGTNALSFTVNSPTQITATPAAGTTGTIKVTTSSTATSTGTFTVNPLPTSFTVTGTGSYCSGGSGLVIGLSGSSVGVNYQLYNGSNAIGAVVPGTGTAISFGLQTTTATYTVIASNANCSSTMSGNAVVTISTQPTATAGGTQTICQNGTATVSGATSTNGTIAWTQNGAGSITSGATTLTPVYTPATGDSGNTVTLTMTVSNSPCTAAIATYMVKVNALPSSPTSVTPAITTTICSGSSINLNATSVGNTIYWYTVNNGGSPIGTSASGANFTYLPSVSNTYYAEAVSAASCPSVTRTATTTITVRALPTTPTITVTNGSAALCTGSTVTLSSSNTPTNGTYLWSNGATSRNITVSSAGSYTVQTISSDGCKSPSSSATLVTVNAIPVATITGANGV